MGLYYGVILLGLVVVSGSPVVVAGPVLNRLFASAHCHDTHKTLHVITTHIQNTAFQITDVAARAQDTKIQAEIMPWYPVKILGTCDMSIIMG